MASQVASLFAVVGVRDNATPALRNMSGTLRSVGGQMRSFGTGLTVAMAPVALALGGAARAAADFDEAMTNIGAVAGMTRAEIETLGDEILQIGMNSQAGPQAVAEAMYDIVGGVADATTHMDILNAAIRTSEAGNADLAGTTSALIAVMNSYSFAAEEAGYASDVLTRTVGMGVGTMDEFASALPQVTGLANSLGISFGDLGSMTAYLTTQGNSASQATTQLAAMMTALLNPNENMRAALVELGFASGEAAIQELGLVGAMEALQGTSTANEKGMAAMLGSTEALRGVTALAGPEFKEFTATFTSGIDGATEAARNVQLESATAQFNTLKSSLSGLAITVGEAVLPILTSLATDMKPVIDNVVAWIQENPELTKQIILVAGALMIAGPALGIVGTGLTLISSVIGLVSAGFGLLTGAVGILLSPVGILIGLIAGAGGLLHLLGGEGGIPAALARAGQAARDLAGILLLGPIAAIKLLIDKVGEAIGALGRLLGIGSGGVNHSMSAGVGTAATAINFGNHFVAAMNQAIAEGLTGDAALQRARQIMAASGGGGGASGSTASAGAAPQLHDFVGGYSANQPLLVGTGAQPELFVPSSSGMAYPAGQWPMGGMNITIQNINANTYEGGRAAARGFQDELSQSGLMQRMQERGFN